MLSLMTLAGTGLLIGISTALSPGPLMALVIRESLRHGFWAGAMIALTPILTDAPMIALSITVARSLHIPSWILGIISLCGALVLFRIGWENVRVSKKQFAETTPTAKKSLLQAIIVNIFNPYPYLFWFSIATPMFSRTNGIGIAVLSSSLILGVVGTMMGTSAIISLTRTKYMKYIPKLTRILGGILMLFAILLVAQGIQFLLE